MGLDNFMDLGVEAEQEQDTHNPEDEEESTVNYTYNGGKEVLDLDWCDVRDYVISLDYDFKDEIPIAGMNGASMESENGSFHLAIRWPWDFHGSDCVLVTVLEDQTGYDVIEPHKVWKVDGWKEELQAAIEAVLDNKDELVFCDECGGVMIIRETNTTNERIRGCSNYPDCRNRDKI